MRCDGTIHILETGYLNGIGIVLVVIHSNTISANTAALYTASLTSGSNQYKEVPGMKVLDGNGNAKVIKAKEWKTSETFELKSVDSPFPRGSRSNQAANITLLRLCHT